MDPQHPVHLQLQNPQSPPQFETIAADWFGAAIAAAPAFRLVLIPGEAIELHARANKHPVSAMDSTAGEFCEGLWQHDCAELFLANPATGHYIEFNIAPNGAWWSCLLESPRLRARIENLPLDGVVSEGIEGVARWETKLHVPLAALPPEIGTDIHALRGNVTFCLGSAPRQIYVTYADLGTGTPDFHQPARWLPVRG